MDEEQKTTPTDALIDALESAEEMKDVIVVFTLEDGSGYGWFSNIESTMSKIGILEEVKMGIFKQAYPGNPE